VVAATSGQAWVMLSVQERRSLSTLENPSPPNNIPPVSASNTGPTLFSQGMRTSSSLRVAGTTSSKESEPRRSYSVWSVPCSLSTSNLAALASSPAGCDVNATRFTTHTSASHTSSPSSRSCGDKEKQTIPDLVHNTETASDLKAHRSAPNLCRPAVVGTQDTTELAYSSSTANRLDTWYWPLPALEIAPPRTQGLQSSPRIDSAASPTQVSRSGIVSQAKVLRDIKLSSHLRIVLVRESCDVGAGDAGDDNEGLHERQAVNEALQRLSTLLRCEDLFADMGACSQ